MLLNYLPLVNIQFAWGLLWAMGEIKDHRTERNMQMSYNKFERNLMVYKVTVSFCSSVCFHRFRCRHNLLANNLFYIQYLKVKVGSVSSYGPLAFCKDLS